MSLSQKDLVLVMVENCTLIGIDNPLRQDRWRDIAPALERLLGRARVGSAQIPTLLGLPAPGPAHDALADARAIAAGWRHWRDQGLFWQAGPTALPVAAVFHQMVDHGRVSERRGVAQLVVLVGGDLA